MTRCFPVFLTWAFLLNGANSSAFLGCRIWLVLVSVSDVAVRLMVVSLLWLSMTLNLVSLKGNDVKSLILSRVLRFLWCRCLCVKLMVVGSMLTFE